MFEQIWNLRNLRLNYKIIIVAVASLILLLLFLLQRKFFFLFIATGLSIVLSVIIGFFPPLKVFGIELVTFSTILAGSFYGPVTGAIFGVCLLIIHLIAARYSGGPYIAWTIPSYILIGVLSGFLTDVKMLVAMVVGVILLDNFLTLTFYRENFIKTILFSIGNLAFNILLIVNLFHLVTGLI
jgi:hypothetical protein